MNQIQQLFGGFMFGIGLILASFLMRYLFHVGLCG